MPGVIENGDPGDHGSGLSSSVTFSSGPEPEPTEVEVELFVDRLRFIGFGHDIVDEFDRRARLDWRAAHDWLNERLAAFEPPREPPSCECGEPLVDVSWRGRATVRCSVCGARWGVEVVDEDTESRWSISGPADAWRAAHPLAVYDPYGAFPPEDVLGAGLPPLPSSIEPGTYFPVAVWKEAQLAGVLYVHRREPGEFHLPGEEYENETEHMFLDDAGEWQSRGSGGSGWVNVFDPPRDLLDKYLVFGTGTSGYGDGDDAVNYTGGICSTSVAAVETADAHGTRREAIDPARPFFLTGVRGSGRVRILDHYGEVLRSWTGEELTFVVGSDRWVDTA